MKTKAKIIIAAVLAIAISIGSIAIYKHITGPKEESIPLETTLEDAAELTTQKMIISDVFRSTKGEIPLINKNRFLVQYKTTRSRYLFRTARSMRILLRSNPVI